MKAQYDETAVWRRPTFPHEWMLDKLLLARRLGYVCGPVGVDVPESGWYCVRPCVNALGMGIGARKVWIGRVTDSLPIGAFWCEWFEGEHLTVDYSYGSQGITVLGEHDGPSLSRWRRWVRVVRVIPLPFPELESEPHVNVEFVGGNVIEIHFRHNPDFIYGNSEFWPVYEHEECENHPALSSGRLVVTQDPRSGRIGGVVR